jgi:hypothetical protein
MSEIIFFPMHICFAIAVDWRVLQGSVGLVADLQCMPVRIRKGTTIIAAMRNLLPNSTIPLPLNVSNGVQCEDRESVFVVIFTAETALVA